MNLRDLLEELEALRPLSARDAEVVLDIGSVVTGVKYVDGEVQFDTAVDDRVPTRFVGREET